MMDSLTYTTFHRKTRRGSIVKIVREHYLRNDIFCGYTKCSLCKDKTSLHDISISKQPRKDINKLCSESHIVLPDLTVLLTQLDVLEEEDFGDNVILLHSLINEVRQKNLSLYSRIKDISKDRKFFLFFNEFHRDTFTERLPQETIDEYNTRLLINAADWYSKHLAGHLKVILLSNDIDIGKQCSHYDFIFYTFEKYVENLYNNVNILDKLARFDEPMEVCEKISTKFLYTEHIPLSLIHIGIKEGRYYQSKFMANRFNWNQGYCSITKHGENIRVFIQGREAVNRAIDEDIVAIELEPEENWKPKVDYVLNPEINESDDEDGNVKDYKPQIGTSEQQSKCPTGKVIGIIKRNWRQYCGVLRTRDRNVTNLTLSSHYFIPVERKIPIISIETRQYDVLINQGIVVAIDNWPRNSKFPKGHYVRMLGPMNEKSTENEMLLLEYDVPHLQFSKSVIKCLPDPKTWTIPSKEYHKRLDLREEYICSVDPPGCTDIDDALHCKDLGDGIYEVGVHIADVSYFIKPETPIDIEAANRGTTVYLIDQRVEMIPPTLSSNLCSLLENQERLTFSVIWKMDSKNAKILDTRIVKSIIKSKAALTYAEAQIRIDSTDNDQLTQSLRKLNSLAKILKASRIENGALILANVSEIQFIEVDSETHDNVTQIESKKLRETNSMVEEFMLLANISVAKVLFENLAQLALLRCHPKPSQANFDELIEAGKSRGFFIDVTDGKTLFSSLNNAIDPNDSYVNTMLRIITTRCMTSAQYFCSGKLANPEENFLHFGLATPIYTHFTSPIRRYADLVVHRQLNHIIEEESLHPSLVNPEKIQSICENINYRHRQAQYASRASIRLHTILYIRNSKQPIEENGYVFSLSKNALHLLIPSLAFETIYHLNPIENWKFDVIKREIIHIPSSVKFKQFDPLLVRLSLIDKNNSFRKGSDTINVEILEPSLNFEEEHNNKRKKI